ncbi:hypothetical protein KPP03845_100036 [Streptomyces xanthophaeus]|nr:hypothetical protein KPP03845_100036 [Streptomyces xanthophaeus]
MSSSSWRWVHWWPTTTGAVDSLRENVSSAACWSAVTVAPDAPPGIT